jgi:hypothetical protein
MADLVGQIQRDIESRLKELRPLLAEKEQLEAVLAALTSDANGGASQPRARAARAAAAPVAAAERAPYAGGRRRRAPRGANREAILAVVRERPGVSAAEVADVTKIAKPTVHTTISQLKRKGILEPEGANGVRLAKVS